MEMRKYFQPTEITHQNLQYVAGSRLESSQKKKKKNQTGKTSQRKDGGKCAHKQHRKQDSSEAKIRIPEKMRLVNLQPE